MLVRVCLKEKNKNCHSRRVSKGVKVNDGSDKWLTDKGHHQTLNLEILRTPVIVY